MPRYFFEWEVLVRISKELDGEVWSPDTLNRVAAYLREAGFEIREPADREDTENEES